MQYMLRSLTCYEGHYHSDQFRLSTTGMEKPEWHCLAENAVGTEQECSWMGCLKHYVDPASLINEDTHLRVDEESNDR